MEEVGRLSRVCEELATAGDYCLFFTIALGQKGDSRPVIKALCALLQWLIGALDLAVLAPGFVFECLNKSQFSGMPYISLD